MRFDNAISEIKSTGGIIKLKRWNFCVAITALKNPMILLDGNSKPIKNRDYKPNEFKSKWMLWDASPKLILDDSWKIEKRFTPEEKEYFSKWLGD